MRNPRSIAYSVLVRSSGARESGGVSGRVWRRAYGALTARWGEEIVETTIHGRRGVINFANPYQVFEHTVPNYNAPQVEVVLLANELLGRKVHVIDVGSSLGDTAMLLMQRCHNAIKRIDCIDGDTRFFPLLQRNVDGTIAVPHLLMLSDEEQVAPELVRTQHEGTASAVGPRTVHAYRLDQKFDHADVIKVDVDGFDGTVLAGATKLLAKHPIVLFEWHPLLCEHVGADWRLPFRVLADSGYNRFVLFTKFGDFSQVFYGVDWQRLDQLADLCLHSESLVDWHYDVVALRDLDDQLTSLAGLERWFGSR